MQHAADGLRVSEHASDLAHRTVIVDSLEFTSIQVCIPVCHVDDEVIILWAGVVELGEGAAGMQIMVVLVDLAKCITDLKVGFEIIHPVTLGTVNRDAAVWTFEMRMGRWACVGSIFPGLGIMR